MHHIAVAMCHSLELPCVTLLRCHVASDTLCLEKRAIPTISEFDEIRRGSYISRDNFNDEVRFVIRDLENFRFSTEITVLPFFRKIEFFSRVLHLLLPNTSFFMSCNLATLLDFLQRYQSHSSITICGVRFQQCIHTHEMRCSYAYAM